MRRLHPQLAGTAALLWMFGSASGSESNQPEAPPESPAPPGVAYIQGKVTPAAGQVLPDGLLVRIAVYRDTCPVPANPFGGIDPYLFALVAPDGSYHRDLVVLGSMFRACLVTRVEKSAAEALVMSVGGTLDFDFPGRDTLRLDFTLP